MAGDGIERKFNTRSSLKRETKKDADANAAQIDRRAREDTELLEDLLRARGYYEARDDRLITAAHDVRNNLLVTFTVDQGKLFTRSEEHKSELQSTITNSYDSYRVRRTKRARHK